MTGPFQIVRKTVFFYRENFLDCLLFGFLSQMVSIVGMMLSPLSRLSALPNLSSEWLSENVGQVVTLGMTWIFWAVLNLWLYLLIAAAIAKLVWKRTKNEEAQVVSASLSAFEQGGPLLWANMLTAFIIGSAAFCASILFLLQRAAANTPGGGLILSLLLLACMSGVVFLCLKFSLVTPIVLLEGKKGRDALNRSWFLMTGRESDAFFLFAFLFAILLLFGVLMGFLRGGELNTTVNPDAATFSMIENIIGIVIAPLFPIGITYFYQDIVAHEKKF